MRCSWNDRIWQLDGEVDLPDVDPVRYHEYARREVQNARYTRPDQTIGHLAGRVRGRGDHPDRDPLRLDHGLHLGDVAHHQAADPLADPPRIGVEQGRRCGTAGEPGITGERVAQVPDADQRHRTRLVQAQHLFDLLDQQPDVVTDPRVP